MANDAHKAWYVQGLQAMKSANEQGKGDPGETSDAITSPELKGIMAGSTKVLAQHAQTIDQLLRKAGGDPGGTPNVIMHGIREGSGHIVQAAKDPAVRDAGIIAASQITVHYYIAAYGTLASTAKFLGLDEDAKMLEQMTDEMKVGDERLTEVAKSMVNQQAA